MKAFLILAAAFALATPAFSQSDQGAGDQGRSDQYACNHGAPDDPRTIDACARLRSGEAPAAATTEQTAPNATGAYPYPAPRYTPPHYTPPADQDEVASNAAMAAKAAKVGQSGQSEAPKTEHAAAPPPPTDVGEAPLNGDEQANDNGGSSTDDEDNNIHISSGRWWAGLGAFAVGLIVLGGLIGLPIYFLPSIIAIAGHKRNTLAIFAINLFPGWSFIGWIVALVWSLASDKAY